MIKRTVSIILLVFLLLTATVSAYAKTYIVIDNYRLSKSSDGSLEIAGYEGTSSDITVPSDFYGNPVTTIESRAFADNTDLNSVILPDTMTSIGNGAFSDSMITSISIGSNTTSVGSNAFYNCSKLKSVDLGSALTEISPYSFNRCSSLVKTELPDSVKSIGEYAFFRCSSLEYILIPSSVTEIAENAFEECNRLTIYGETGSYAQQFAEAFSIPFRSLSGGTTTDKPNIDESSRGDADGNGVINNDDVRILQMFCLNLVDRGYIVVDYSDANGDGVLNIKDCTSIQRYLGYGRF